MKKKQEVKKKDLTNIKINLARIERRDKTEREKIEKKIQEKRS